jgi:transcriptional regulator with XRE-family HTH domain
MKDQLIKIMTHFNITATRFADEIGVQRSSISHILSGRNKPSYDFILRVIEKYPAVNTQWLLTGKGDMIQGKAETISSINSDTDQQPELFMPENIPDSDNNNKSKREKEGLIDISKQHKDITNVNDLDSIIVLYTDGTFFHYSKRNEK